MGDIILCEWYGKQSLSHLSPATVSASSLISFPPDLPHLTTPLSTTCVKAPWDHLCKQFKHLIPSWFSSSKISALNGFSCPFPVHFERIQLTLSISKCYLPYETPCPPAPPTPQHTHVLVHILAESISSREEAHDSIQHGSA